MGEEALFVEEARQLSGFCDFYVSQRYTGVEFLTSIFAPSGRATPKRRVQKV